MKVFLLKDIADIGIAGQIKNVEPGFARNFLIPRKLAVEITKDNEHSYLAKIKKVEHQKEVVTAQTSHLAERIKAIKISLKKKMHDDGKLYGAISAVEIVDSLAKEGIAIGKNQVEFNKSIKQKGTFEVVIKLTSRLKPVLHVNVIPE